MAGETLLADWSLFGSVNRTAANEQSDVAPRGHLYRGVVVTLDITAFGGTSPTLDVKLQGKSAATGVWADIPSAAFAQQTGTATLALTVPVGGPHNDMVLNDDLIESVLRDIDDDKAFVPVSSADRN